MPRVDEQSPQKQAEVASGLAKVDSKYILAGHRTLVEPWACKDRVGSQELAGDRSSLQDCKHVEPEKRKYTAKPGTGEDSKLARCISALAAFVGYSCRQPALEEECALEMC